MPGKYTTLTGLWSKDTQRGQVLSCKLTPATRDKIRAALDGVPDPAELVVFVNDRRDKDTSPTHTLVVAVSEPRPGGGTGAAPQAARESKPVPAAAQRVLEAFPEASLPEDEDPIPFGG